jgi:hypothetical protein
MVGSVTKLGHQQERKPHVLRGFWRGKHVRQQQTAVRRGTGRCEAQRGAAVRPSGNNVSSQREDDCLVRRGREVSRR